MVCQGWILSASCWLGPPTRMLGLLSSPGLESWELGVVIAAMSVHLSWGDSKTGLRWDHWQDCTRVPQGTPSGHRGRRVDGLLTRSSGLLPQTFPRQDELHGFFRSSLGGHTTSFPPHSVGYRWVSEASPDSWGRERGQEAPASQWEECQKYLWPSLKHTINL